MNKKYLLVFALLMVGCVSAAWVISYQSNTTGLVIDSESEFVFSDDFSVENVNTSSSAVNKVDYLTITNNNGETNLTVDINTTITDMIDECNNSGDVTVNVNYEYAPIQDGDIITVENGVSKITVFTNATERACPQEVATVINLS